MAFDKRGLSFVGGTKPHSPQVWAYKTSDALAVVEGSGYFDNGTTNRTDIRAAFQVGDAVDVYSSLDTIPVVSRLYVKSIASGVIEMMRDPASTVSDADKPILLMGGDHPYAQWGGNGMLKSYLDNRIEPYLAINTAGLGVTPGDSDTLSWSQLAALKSQVELCNHGARHIQHWTRINTGIRVVYSGAAGSATMQVTSSGVVLVGNGGAENATITFSNEPTIAELCAAISAQGGGVWTATAAAELTGTEASGNLLVVAARNVKASTNNQYFAAGGGIIIRYAGLAYESVYATRTANPSLEIYFDGVRLVNYTLSAGTHDTLTEVVAAINAAGITGLSAALCDNGRAQKPAFLSYLQGDEDSQNLKIMQVEIQLTSNSIDAGLPRWYMVDRQMEAAHATALANGITFTHFAESGADFFPPMAVHRYASYRGTHDAYRRAISPFQIPAAVGDPGFTILQTTQDNSSNPWTSAQAIAVLDALADSGPFIINLMNHKVLPDGSSSYTFTNPDSYHNMTEPNWIAMLAAAKAHIQAGSIQSLKPSASLKARRARNKPLNYIFNPKFRNDGTALLNASDAGFKVPGWYITASNSIYSAVSIADEKLTLTATSSTATIFASQELMLEPARTYEIGMLVEIPTFTSGTGLRAIVRPKFGRFPGMIVPGTNRQFVGQRVVGTATNGNRIAHMKLRFTVPKPVDYRPPKVISNASGTFNLGSSPADIKINIDSKAQLNVNVAGGTPGATTTDEVVAAINTAIAGSASYPVEYRGAAKNVANKVVITGPYLGIEERNDAGYGISLDAGTTNSATSTIFGNAQCRAVSMPEAYADGTQSLWYLEVRSEMIGTFRISSPYVRELMSA